MQYLYFDCDNLIARLLWACKN